MRVYRIEHRKTRKGPYQPEPDGDTPAEYGGRFGCDIYYNSATHPGPFCAKEWDTQLAQGKPDGGGRWKRSWGLFGFVSLRSARRWFKVAAFRRWLDRRGFVLASYEIPSEHVWRGNFQIVFDRRVAKRVSEQPVASLITA